MNGLREWVKILVPLILMAGLGYSRLVVVETQATQNKFRIEKMSESWLSPDDVKELKTLIGDLTKEVTKLKVAIASMGH